MDSINQSGLRLLAACFLAIALIASQLVAVDDDHPYGCAWSLFWGIVTFGAAYLFLDSLYRAFGG